MTRTAGVLGLGSIGLRHSKNFLSLGWNVVGFDPDPARREALAAAGGKAFTSREAVIASAEIIIVATPNWLHRDDVWAAITAGAHVLVEKPFAHSLDGMNALLEQAAHKGLKIGVAHNLRFNPVVVLAKKLISAGEIGEPIWARFVCGSYLPSWRPHQDYRKGYTADVLTGGVIFDVVHEFDVGTYLLGPLKTEYAAARRTGLLDVPTEDCADILMRNEQGCRVSLHLDYVTRPTLRTSDIVGALGRIEMDIAGRRIRHHLIDGSCALDWTAPTHVDEDYRDLARAFVDSLDNGTPLSCPGEEALAVLEEVVAARRLAGLSETA